MSDMVITVSLNVSAGLKWFASPAPLCNFCVVLRSTPTCPLWPFTCFSLHLSLIMSCKLKSSLNRIRLKNWTTELEWHKASQSKREREQQGLSCKSPDSGGVTQPCVNTPPSSSLALILVYVSRPCSSSVQVAPGLPPRWNVAFGAPHSFHLNGSSLSFVHRRW